MSVTLSRREILAIFCIAASVGSAVALGFRHRAEQDAAVATATAGVDVARTQVTVTDTTYRHDTTRFHRVLEATDTVRAHVVITDTTSVRRALVQDSVALKSCTLVVSSCEARVAARDKLIDSLGREADALRVVAYRPPARLGGSASIGYEPIAALPHVTASGTVRLAGQWYLEGRGNYTMAPGERPRWLALLTWRF